MDLEERIRALKEYDLSTDKIKPEQIDDKDVVVLLKNSNTDLVMSQQIPYANLLDRTRFFSNRSHSFSLKSEEAVQDFPVTAVVNKRSKVTYFDLSELPKE